MNNMSLRFDLFGIPTEIKASFLLLGVFMFTWVKDVGGAIELMLWAGIAVILHELGHAWAFKRYGCKPSILIHMIGGVASARGEKAASLTNGQHIIIVLAGPAMSILMGVVLWGIIQLTGSLPHYFLDSSQAISYPLFFSFGWGILNLIPIYPLDGGQFLRYVLEYNPKWNAERIALIVGIALGGILIAYCLYIGSIWNAMLVGFLISGNVSRLQASRDQGYEVQTNEIVNLVNAGDLDQALFKLQALIPSLKSDHVKIWAYQLAGTILKQNRQRDKIAAFTAACPEYDVYVPELKLIRLSNEGKIEEALDYASKAFAIKPTQELADAWVQLLVANGRKDEVPEVLARIQPFLKTAKQ